MTMGVEPISRNTFLRGAVGMVALAGTRMWPSARSAQGAKTSAITVDLAAKTGKTLHPFLYGYATGALLDNDVNLAADKVVESTAETLAPPLIRLDTAGGTLIQRTFANGVADPDWTHISRWVQHRGDFLRTGGRLIFGIGPSGDDTSISPATWGKYARSIALHFREVGQEITFWEVGNECDPMGAPAYSAYFNAVADAVHSVNRASLVGGPVASWWNGIDLPTFVSRSGTRLGFIDFHSYPIGHTDSAQVALGRAASFVDISSARQAVAGTVAENLPIGLLEYNMYGGELANGLWGIPAQGTITGAVYVALLLTQSFASDPAFTMGGLWDLVSDSNFGVIGNAQDKGSYRAIDQQGRYLRQAARLMPGQQVKSSKPAPGLQVMATRNGQHFSIQLVNYNLAQAQSVTLTVTGRKAGSRVDRWELSAQYPSGQDSTITSLAPVRVPPRSIVILYGQR
jgi:hypothetical protein